MALEPCVSHPCFLVAESRLPAAVSCLAHGPGVPGPRPRLPGRLWTRGLSETGNELREETDRLAAVSARPTRAVRAHVTFPHLVCSVQDTTKSHVQGRRDRGQARPEAQKFSFLTPQVLFCLFPFALRAPAEKTEFQAHPVTRCSLSHFPGSHTLRAGQNCARTRPPLRAQGRSVCTTIVFPFNRQHGISFPILQNN